jgi:type IV pilus modification protein PilV
MHTVVTKETSMLRSIQTTRGATLLEVMIALMIFSIGMLGLAALQVTGLRETGNSEKRTQATLVANDIIERMRSNITATTAGDYAAVNYAAIDCATPPATYCEDDESSAATACSTTQMATFDAQLVYCQANKRLPSGSLSVACTDNAGVAAACAGTVYRTITLNWVNNNDFGNTSKIMSLTFRP